MHLNLNLFFHYSKTQEIYNYLEQRRLSQLADYEPLEETAYTMEVAKSDKCREFEKFLDSDNEKAAFNINLFYGATDNELEFFARKFIEVGIEKPQRIKFLAFTAYKFQGVLNSIRKIVNNVVKHLEEEIEVMRQKNQKNPIPMNNLAKFIAELYVNERKIISPIMMTSWLSLLTELGESTAITSTLKVCGYFYKIDEPENFDKFMDSIKVFWTIVNDEIMEISDQLNGKGQEVYVEYQKSRMFQPNPSVESLDDLDQFLFETSRSKTFNFDFQNLLEFRYSDMFNTARTIVKEVARPNANVIKIAEFLKSFFEFSFKIGKFVKRLKINFEMRISEMTLDDLKEMKNVGKLIGELRNLTVIDKIPQEKWLEMIESLNGLKNSKVMEIQLEVLKVMLQNLLIHDEDRYVDYLKDIKAIDTSDSIIKSKILQITQNTVDKKIDKASKDVLFRIKVGSKIDGLPQGIPTSNQTEFDLNDFVKVFLVQAISNRFLMEFYTRSMKSLTNGRRNDFGKILLDLCKDRFMNILNPELFDEDEAVGTLKIIRNLFKPSILTVKNNETFLQQMLEFKDFENHKNCIKILLGMIKSVVIFTETRNKGESNKNLRTLLRQVEVKLTGIEDISAEDQEEVEIWHIVDYQGFTNEKSLLESESIEPSQLAWSFTENYQVKQKKMQKMLENPKNVQKPAQNVENSGRALNLFNQHPGNDRSLASGSRNTNQKFTNANQQKSNQGAKKANKPNWNVTRGDMKHRNDLQNQPLPNMNKRNDQNRHNQAQNGPNSRNNPNGGQNRTQNLRRNQNSGQNYSNMHNKTQYAGNFSHNLDQNRQNKHAIQNIQNLHQNQQKVNNASTSGPNLASNTQTERGTTQSSSSGQNSCSGSGIIQGTKSEINQNTQSSTQNTKSTTKLTADAEIKPKSNQTTNIDQSSQKPNQTDPKSVTNDKPTNKSIQNVQSSVQNDQKVQKLNEVAQKEPVADQNDQNISQFFQKLIQKTENSNQEVQKPQVLPKTAPQATQVNKIDQNPPTTSQQAQNLPNNINKLPSNPASADLQASLNEVMPLISTSTLNFRNCAILIHGWGLNNPALWPEIKEFTTLVTKELLLNHKQLMVDMTTELRKECDELRRKQQVQRKNIFVTTVKAVMPFLVKCSFYNMLDDLLGQIKNGNIIALPLFLDLTEGMKEFLTEDCRERDQFVPNCVQILEKATKFKGDEATRKRTFEMFKFFEGQKVNAVNNWRDNSNSRMRNASSTQSVSSSNNSEKRARRRRFFLSQNNQGRGSVGSNGRGGASKMNNAHKSGNITSKVDNITSKSELAPKSSNTTSKVDNITSKSEPTPKSSNITSKVDNITSKPVTTPSNPQKSITDPSEDFKIDDKIKFYINQLDASNTAAIGLKITPFLQKEFIKRKVLDALLDKGVSDQKFITPVIDLFEFLFRKNNFKANKILMSDVIGNGFIYVCEKQNKMAHLISNFARFTRAFESFLKNSFIFYLWRELLEFVKCDTPNVLENLVFLMSDRLELFSETKGRKDQVKIFLMVFKEKLKVIKDKDLKIKLEKIIKSLESGEFEGTKKNKADNKISESNKQVEKVTESPAQKTKKLMKLFGVGDDDEDGDLFNQIKNQIQSGPSSQAGQMGNICCKIGQKSEESDLKPIQNEDNPGGLGAVPTIIPEKLAIIPGIQKPNPESSALLDLQANFEQISIQDASNTNISASETQNSTSKIAESSNQVENKQAKLIQGLTKQLDSLEIEDKSTEVEKSSSPTINELISSTNQDDALKANRNDSEQTQKDKLDSSTSIQPIKKPSSTRPHPDDKIRPLIFTSDYILFDESVENRQKFADILKVMCSCSEGDKNSIEVREKIAVALIKLNYLKVRSDLDDFAEVFFKIYTKPGLRSFNQFIMIKFLKAWKFYEEDMKDLDERIYDRFSKSVCRIKKAFVVSSDVPMDGNLTSRSGNVTPNSNLTSKLNITLKFSLIFDLGGSALPKTSNITSKSDQPQADQATNSHFNKFLLHLTQMLTNFIIGLVTIKQEYKEEAILARRPGICQLISDLYLHGITSSEFTMTSIRILVQIADNDPNNFNFLTEIIKNVGALLEIREKEKFDEIFQKIFLKIQENPEKVVEIIKIRKNQYASVENFTPIFLLFHENPGKFYGFIETLWKRLMENPEKVAELSEIVEELLENLGEKFAFLISEFMENRRISFEKIPAEMFSKAVCQRLKGSILFSLELFEMQILTPERFSGWFKDEVFGKLTKDENDEILNKMLSHGIDIRENLIDNLNEQHEKLNIF